MNYLRITFSLKCSLCLGVKLGSNYVKPMSQLCKRHEVCKFE